MIDINVENLLTLAQSGITEYLDDARRDGRIDQQLFDSANQTTFDNLSEWLQSDEIDTLSPNFKAGLASAIEAGRWEAIVNAFRQSVRFGTGGIRGMMAFDRDEIVQLKNEGIDAPILKGTNTLNNIVLMLTSAGVARYGRDQNPKFDKIVIGYDSRIRGQDLAMLVAEVFLAYGYTVYFFDEPCPYPEVTFAIPQVQADVGILISASHNDYRYNGYKLSCANGSQFDPDQRDAMYDDYIAKSDFSQIKRLRFTDAPKDKVVFLGGSKPVSGYDYAGRDTIINMHEKHRNHVKQFLMTDTLASEQAGSAESLRIAYCAFHGAGRVAVPRLLKDVGFTDIRSITKRGLNDLDGLFPSFCSDRGKEQQPDPGDCRAAKTAVQAFQEEYPGKFDDIDILIGTDPDADRCGVVIKVPPEQRDIYGGNDYFLLPADDAWALLLWYRFHRQIEKHGHIPNADEKFVVLSQTTSDATARLAIKHRLGVVKTWVGFASLAAATGLVWAGKTGTLLDLVEGRNESDYIDICHPIVCDCENMNEKRSFNVAAMEQSNGFSILGGPPPNERSLGTAGHVRDKDGTLAAMLVAEVAAWAKQKGTTLLELLDNEIYLDPDVGLFVNLYEPDPLDGEYPGIEGDRLKKTILRRAMGFYQLALAGDLEIAGKKVLDASIYRTGKYDAIYPQTYDFSFPDEGIRLFLSDDRLDHLIIRPSGTGNSLRFHVQLHANPTKENLVETKRQLRKQGLAIMDAVRVMLKAPRNT